MGTKVAVLLVALLAHIQGGCYAGAPVDELLTAWRAKESLADSAQIKLETESFSAMAGPLRLFGLNGPSDPQATTTHLKEVITLQDKKIRHECSGTTPLLGEDVETIKVNERQVYNGKTTRTASRYDRERSVDQGLIVQKNTTPLVTNLRFAPLRFCLRPISLGLEGKTERIADVRNVETDNGKILRVTLRNQGELDVDPASGYSVVAMRNARGTWSQDVTYAQDNEGRWVPTGWVGTMTTPIGVLSKRTKVTDFQLNIEVPPDSFKLEFAPGARVVVLSGEEGQEREDEYVAAENGTLVPAAKGE